MSTRDPSCQSFRETNIARRTLLRAGGMSLLGMSMPKFLRAAEASAATAKIAPKAKSVIFLFQWGGPSQIDILDMKPEAPKEYRSPHKQIRTSCPEIEICEHLPRMAQHMDKCTVIRTLHHTMNNHNSAGYYALSGTCGRRPTTSACAILLGPLSLPMVRWSSKLGPNSNRAMPSFGLLPARHLRRLAHARPTRQLLGQETRSAVHPARPERVRLSACPS